MGSNAAFTRNGSTSFQLDVSSSDSISNAKQQTERFLEDNTCVLWSIINNAGISGGGLFEWLSQAKIHGIIDVNLRGVIDVCHEFVPLLQGRKNRVRGYKVSGGGRVINISSISAALRVPNLVAYASTKAAVSHFTHCLRTELSPRFGIWCATMEFGGFKTEMLGKAIDTQKQNAVANSEGLIGYNIEKENRAYARAANQVEWPSDLSPAVDDIVHALTAKYPRRCYRAGVPMFLHIAAPLLQRYHFMERVM